MLCLVQLRFHTNGSGFATSQPISNREILDIQLGKGCVQKFTPTPRFLNRLHLVTNGFTRFFLAPLLPYSMFCTMLPNTPLTCGFGAHAGFWV